MKTEVCRACERDAFPAAVEPCKSCPVAVEARRQKERADSALASLHEEQDGGTVTLPILDLPGIGYVEQTMKLVEEFSELLREVNHPKPNNSRVCAEALDVIQVAVKIVALAVEQGCDLDAISREHMETIKRRGLSYQSVIEAKVRR